MADDDIEDSDFDDDPIDDVNDGCWDDLDWEVWNPEVC